MGRAWMSAETQKGQKGSKHSNDEHGHDEEQEVTAVTLRKEKWDVAGLRVQQVERGTLSGAVWVTGKLTLNEDRLAHIYSLVDGRVHEVNVQFGDDVKQDQSLAIIDSKEVGAAKLGLFQNRLDAEFAKVNDEWNQKINTNTQELIKAMEQGTPITKIDELFGDKPMGEYRAQILVAYASLHKSKADFERLSELARQSVVAGKQLLAARAAYEADQATFLALQEQLKFTAWQRALLSKQNVRRAEQAVGVSESQLYILGYHEANLADIDPNSEGERIAHYTINAPFDGTVIGKNVVLAERVGPDTEMFQVADLSTLWVQADIYQKDLPKLDQLGDTLHFRAPNTNHEHSAKIFYTGDILDPATRTVRLRAIVENPDRRLKAGMFVEVALPGESILDVIRVPMSALQEIEGKDVVFVQTAEEQFQKRTVVVGARSDGMVQIHEGVQAGESVVVAGGFSLKSEMMKGSMSHGH
ncbi:MAG: efflux RND transporter periplasmic adaptor subunit [Pirellulales bacterium]